MEKYEFIVTKQEEIFPFDGYEISRNVINQKKKKRKYEEIEGLGYGEVDVVSFQKYLMENISPLLKKHPENENNNTGSVFLDVGAGTGKAVIASLPFFTNAVGIEILKELHEKSEKSLEIVQQYLLKSNENSQCRFELGDCLKEDFLPLWKEADVIFIPCTLFSDEMMVKINERIISYVKKGALVITTTRKLNITKKIQKLQETRIDLEKGKLQLLLYIINV